MMAPKRTCSVEGCSARAWHDDLCNYHALERHSPSSSRRGGGKPSRPKPLQARLEEGKRVLRERAKELGIQLDEEPQEVAVSGRKGKKARSPVG